MHSKEIKLIACLLLCAWPMIEELVYHEAFEIDFINDILMLCGFFKKEKGVKKDLVQVSQTCPLNVFVFSQHFNNMFKVKQ